MSLPNFEYRSPKSIEQAVALRQEYGDDALVMAGGLTAMILLRERLVKPRVVISLSEIPVLRRIDFSEQILRIGAAVTHSEITNHVLDEPVFGYSDKTLCTTLVDYGSYQPKNVAFPPIIRPKTIKRRSSPVISKRYRRNHSIHYKELAQSKNLFIPTIYQQNYLYGPKHAYESDKYYQWHVALSKCLPNMTVKMHPKSRTIPEFNCNVDFRQLDDCIDEYDVLIFDFFSTAAVLAIFSEKPVIYFDIGLRILDEKFKEHLHNRCSVFEIDFQVDWEEQIRDGLARFEQDQRITTNIGLERYSICDKEEFSLCTMLMDIIFASDKYN